MITIAVVPAYGRDYTSSVKAKADWLAGKDFILRDFRSPWDGKPINIEDVTRAYPGADIVIYYKDRRNNVLVKGAKS